MAHSETIIFGENLNGSHTILRSPRLGVEPYSLIMSGTWTSAKLYASATGKDGSWALVKDIASTGEGATLGVLFASNYKLVLTGAVAVHAAMDTALMANRK